MVTPSLQVHPIWSTLLVLEYELVKVKSFPRIVFRGNVFLLKGYPKVEVIFRSVYRNRVMKKKLVKILNHFVEKKYSTFVIHFFLLKCEKKCKKQPNFSYHTFCQGGGLNPQTPPLHTPLQGSHGS
jgi:hypothetical protein